MRFGIAGNTSKPLLWEPVATLLHWMHHQRIDYCLHPTIAEGLEKRQLIDLSMIELPSAENLGEEADIILSFGGDGTLLNTAHEIGIHQTPLLGVNIGRLGFLADVEVGQVQAAVEQILADHFRIEPRLVLAAEFIQNGQPRQYWALNEFVLARGSPLAMISLDVKVDGIPLNTYWADGLIFATPTGSTAYSLSVGGPIVLPGAEVIILSPLSPHTLTVRPIVLPAQSHIEVQVDAGDQEYLLAADGRSKMLDEQRLPITVRQAQHRIHLVKLLDQHYFQTLRNKLAWGVRQHKGPQP